MTFDAFSRLGSDAPFFGRLDTGAAIPPARRDVPRPFCVDCDDAVTRYLRAFVDTAQASKLRAHSTV